MGVRPTPAQTPVKLSLRSGARLRSSASNQFARVHLTLKPFATDVMQPDQLAYAPSESGRVYIAEQTGLILVADANGQIHRESFLVSRSCAPAHPARRLATRPGGYRQVGDVARPGSIWFG